MPRRIARTTSRRHNRAWAGVHSTSYSVVAAGTKVLLGSFAPTTSGDVTVLRSVGILSIASDQKAASEFQQGAFGMIVVTDVALAIGASAVPGPVTNIADDGWFTYQSFHQVFEVVSATGVEPNFATTYVIDSRAKRIVEDGRSVAIMIENAHSTHGIQVAFTVRMLSEVFG